MGLELLWAQLCHCASQLLCHRPSCPRTPGTPVEQPLARVKGSVSHLLLGAKPAVSSEPGPRVEVVVGPAAAPGRSLKTGGGGHVCVCVCVCVRTFE